MGRRFEKEDASMRTTRATLTLAAMLLCLAITAVQAADEKPAADGKPAAEEVQPLPEQIVLQRKSGLWIFIITNYKTEGVVWHEVSYQFEPAQQSTFCNTYLHQEPVNDISGSAALLQKAETKGVLQNVESDYCNFMAAILSHYLEIDIDFPGGTWEELGSELKTQLTKAYETQLPDAIKKLLPQKLEMSVVSPAKSSARFTEVHIKQTTLGYYRNHPLITGSVPIVFDPGIQTSTHLDELRFKYDYMKIAFKLSAPIESEPTEVAFFNLAPMPRRDTKLLGTDVVAFERAARDVAALFEISWMAEKTVVLSKTRLHPETGVLIVQGPSDEIKIARNAYDVLFKKESAANPFSGLGEKLDKLQQALVGSDPNNQTAGVLTKLDELKAAVQNKNQPAAEKPGK
jgi:hypothetical protein